MSLRKPSELFESKVAEEKNSSPAKKYLNDSYQEFEGNLFKIEELGEKIEAIYTEYPKTLEVLSEKLKNRVTKTDLDKAMFTHLSVVDENFQAIKSQIKGLNKKDLKEFKDGVSLLTSIVENLVDVELPRYKNKVTGNEIKIFDKLAESEKKVAKELSQLSFFIEEKVDEFGETKKDLLKIAETYKKLHTVISDKYTEENEKIKEYSNVLEDFNTRVNDFTNDVENKISDYEDYITNQKDFLLDDINKLKKEIKSDVADIKADVVVYERHVDRIEGYIQDNKKDLADLKENVIKDITNILNGDVQTNITRLEKKINDIREKYDAIKPEEIMQDIQEGLVTIPSGTKNSDPLTPLDQNYVTTKQLQDHYRLFLNRIQQQLSTLGGGGETRLQYLDDIVGIATNASAYDGKFLSYNSSIGKFEFKSTGTSANLNIDELNVAGVSTFKDDVNITAGDKINFLPAVGSANTVSLFHEGNVLKIQGQGDSFVLLETPMAVYIREPSSSTNSAIFQPTQAATLFYNGATRFATTAEGIDITGNNVVSGNVTAVDGTFSGNVSIAGTITYDDVTNIDSVGLITARSGINVTGGSVTIGNAAGLTANVNADNLMLGESSGNHGITILSGQAAAGNLFFGDPANTSAAGIQYFHSSNHMEFRIAGGEKVRFTSGGFVGIGSEIPKHKLEVLGDSSLKGNLNVSGIATIGSGASGQAILQYQGTTKLTSESWGTRTSGTVQALNGNLSIFKSVANNTGKLILQNQTGDAFEIAHTSSNSFITGHVGNISINAPTVSISTNFSVGGISTFSGLVDVNAELNTTGNLNVTDGRILVVQSTAPQVRINSSTADESSTRFAFGLAIGANQFINGAQSNDACISAPQEIKFGIGNNLRFRITDSFVITPIDLLPSSNNSRSLGNSNYRWSDLFAVDANISGNLSVAGISTFNGTISITDNLKVVGVGTFGDKVKISSNVNAKPAPSVAGNYHLHITNPQNDAGETVGIAFGLSTGGDIGAAITHEREGTNSFGNLRFYTKENANAATMRERMRISKEGKVGIGSASPAVKLDVAGSLNVSNIANIGESSPTASENGQLNVYTKISGGKTQFVHDAGFGGVRLAGTASASGASLVFSNNYNSGTFDDHWTIQHNGGDDSLRLLSGGTGGTQIIHIKSNGNVGINSTAPTSKLEVLGDSSLKGNVTVSDGNINLIRSGSSTITGNLKSNYTTFDIIDTTHGAQLRLRGGSPTLVFDRSGTGSAELYFDDNGFKIFQGQPAGGGGSTEVVSITNDGNVGINSTAPTEKLVVGLGTAWIYPDEDGTEAIALKLGKLRDYNNSLNDILVADNDQTGSTANYQVTNKINRYLANWHFDRSTSPGATRLNAFKLRSAIEGSASGNSFIIRDLQGIADSTKLWSNGDSFIGVTTDGTTRNLGIGTDSPQAILHVSGKGVPDTNPLVKVGTGVTILTNGNVSIGGTLELFNTTGNASNNPSEIKLSTLSIGQHNNVGTMKIMNTNATGSLIIGAGGGGGYGGISFFNKNLNAKYLQANNEGSIDLYYDNELQFKTSEKGITVGTGVGIETNGQAQFAGIVTVTTPSASKGARNISISTEAPSGGSDGDLWFTYIA